LATGLAYHWGVRLFGRLGVVQELGVALGIWLLLVIGSHAWLRRFSRGPMEWLWRRLEDGRAPPGASANRVAYYLVASCQQAPNAEGPVSAEATATGPRPLSCDPPTARMRPGPLRPAPTGTLAVEPPPLPVVPGYEVLGELGLGGMGVVYLAR